MPEGHYDIIWNIAGFTMKITTKQNTASVKHVKVKPNVKVKDYTHSVKHVTKVSIVEHL